MLYICVYIRVLDHSNFSHFLPKGHLKYIFSFLSLHILNQKINMVYSTYILVLVLQKQINKVGYRKTDTVQYFLINFVNSFRLMQKNITEKKFKTCFIKNISSSIFDLSSYGQRLSLFFLHYCLGEVSCNRTK